MVCCMSRGVVRCIGTRFKEHDSWCNGAKAAEPMGMSNPVAERDAVLCMNIGAARTLVDDVCAKPDSSGSVSRSQGSWSEGTWSVGASERSERGSD